MSSPAPPATKTPEIGETSKTSQAAPGVRIPDTSRKLEYIADISVRSDGLTASKKGRPAHTSNKIRKKEPAIKQTKAIGGVS